MENYNRVTNHPQSASYIPISNFIKKDYNEESVLLLSATV